MRQTTTSAPELGWDLKGTLSQTQHLWESRQASGAFTMFPFTCWSWRSHWALCWLCTTWRHSAHVVVNHTHAHAVCAFVGVILGGPLCRGTTASSCRSCSPRACTTCTSTPGAGCGWRTCPTGATSPSATPSATATTALWPWPSSATPSLPLCERSLPLCPLSAQPGCKPLDAGVHLRLSASQLVSDGLRARKKGIGGLGGSVSSLAA